MTMLTLPCHGVLPLLKNELDRITELIDKKQAAIIQVHLTQRNLERARGNNFLRILFGIEKMPITIEQAKDELEFTTYKFDSFQIVCNGEVEVLTYGRSTGYREQIRTLYLTAKSICENDELKTSTITLDAELFQFIQYI